MHQVTVTPCIHAVLTAGLAGRYVATASEVTAADLVIGLAASRTTPKADETGGGYLTVENKTNAADRLFGASCNVAGTVQVHKMNMDDGVMKMRRVENGRLIEARNIAKLAPGGYHSMMMELKNPLKQGDALPMTLGSEMAGKMPVTLEVEGAGEPRPGGGQMETNDMKKM